MIVRLSDITPGSARVRAVIPASPGAAFGFGLPLGTVFRQDDGRWSALDTEQSLVGCHYSTRKAAVNRLVDLVNSQEQSA
jgi:hypothetical protein